MKKILPLLLALLLLCGCAGEGGAETTAPGPEATEETYSNQGPEGVLDENAPKTVYKLVRKGCMNADGVALWYRDYFYDADGFCTQEMEVSGSGVVTFLSINTANDEGFTASSAITESSGLEYTVTYTYDSQGNVLRQETHMDGVLTEAIDYTYDAQGNYLTLKQYYAGELVLDYAFTYTYSGDGVLLTREETLFGELASHVEMTYDQQGRETASVSTGLDGTVLSRTESTWEGLTETRKYFAMEDTTPYMTSVITYDDHGNVILEENQYDDGTVTMMEYTYEPFEVMN